MEKRAASFLRRELLRVNGTAPSTQEIEQSLSEGRRAFLAGYDAYAKWKDGKTSPENKKS